MEKAKRILLRLCYPGIVWIIVLIVLSVAGLILAFTSGLGESPIAYVAYVMSFYTLVVLVFSIIKSDVVKKSKDIVYNSHYGNKFMTDLLFRAQFSLTMSLIINVVYGAFQLVAGLYYASFWYGAVGIYYFVVCGVRFLILRNFQKGEDDKAKDLRVYRLCGYLLFALNVTTVGMVIQIVRDGEGARYPGIMVYAMATYAFYRISISIINVVKHRKLDNPILSASKNLGLATALMAIFSLQTAMLAEFGGESNVGEIITPITGAGVCVIILCMAILMIVRANRGLKQLNLNISQT